MANVVVALYNFLLRSGNPNAIPPFFEGFINGLKDAGNNVLCFQWNQPQIQLDETIPEKYLEKLKNFQPDIFILFNNQFWDITKHFDCPIIIYDVDSPNAYANIDLIKEKKERYKFIINQSSGIEFVKEKFNCDGKSIISIPPYTSIKAEDKEFKRNIAFCGSNWFWTDFRSVYNFMNANPTKEDIQAARKVYDLYIQNPILTSEEIYEKYNIEAETKIKFDNLFFYALRVSGINRIQTLEAVSDLGLEIRGQYWLNNITLLPFPELLFSYSSEPIHNIQDTADFYNSSKISINTKHIQAKSGFSWRVCDILASNACLVTQPASDLVKFGFNVPTFESPAEAREVCIKLLKNENMRKDIVEQSQAVINKNHRFEHILPQIEDFTGVKLHSDNEGCLENIYLKQTPQNKTAPISIYQFPAVNTHNLNLKKKFCYKISKHFFKRFLRIEE